MADSPVITVVFELMVRCEEVTADPLDLRGHFPNGRAHSQEAKRRRRIKTICRQSFLWLRLAAVPDDGYSLSAF
jgi:hypothetical protein